MIPYFIDNILYPILCIISYKIYYINCAVYTQFTILIISYIYTVIVYLNYFYQCKISFEDELLFILILL